MLDAIVVVNGSAGGPYASGLRFVNLTFTESRVTFLEQYEVPSGGDWSVHRGGALLVQDAENVSVAGCVFDQVGGNGAIFSNHVWRSAITDSEFVRTGDSAIILLGSTNGVDGSAPTYPNHNTLARNHLHEVGLYGKQTSCVGQFLTANSTIEDNVCYNGPRAGININDGCVHASDEGALPLELCRMLRCKQTVMMVRILAELHPFLQIWRRQPF